MNVKCNACGKTQEMEQKQYYPPGGAKCPCGGKMSTIGGKHIQTHKRSKDRKPKKMQKNSSRAKGKG